MSIKNFRDYIVDPSEDPKSFEFYGIQQSQLWPSSEIQLSTDKNSFLDLTPGQKSLIRKTAEFFAPADGAINDQLVALMKDATKNEKLFLFVQAYIETVHAISYAEVVRTFFKEDEVESIFESANNNSFVQAKAEFIAKYAEGSSRDKRSLWYVAGAAMEGIFFVSLFQIITIFAKLKKMGNFMLLNEQVSKDELLHRDFNIYQAKRYAEFEDLKGEKHFNADSVYEILREAVDIEKAHIEYILNDIEDEAKDLDLTVDTCYRYVCSLAGKMMIELGLPNMFTYSPGEIQRFPNMVEEKSPSWMKSYSLSTRQNMHDGRTGNYNASVKDISKAEIDAAFMDEL